MFQNDVIVDMNSPYEECIVAKDRVDKQVVFQNKPVGYKMDGDFGEQETNSYKSKSLLLLVRKILTNQCFLPRE